MTMFLEQYTIYKLFLLDILFKQTHGAVVWMDEFGSLKIALSKGRKVH